MNRDRIFLILAQCISAVWLLYAGAASAFELTLAEGLKRAAENSRLIKIAERDEEIALTDTLKEKSRMLPAVSASAAGTALSQRPGAIFGTASVPLSQRDFLSYSISVQQTLYDFRGNASRYEASRIRMGARGLDRVRVRNLVAVDFALTYLDLLESQKMVALSKLEIERLESHSRDAHALLDEGVATRNDLLQAEVRLADARQRYISMNNLRSVHSARLNTIIVSPLNEEIIAVDYALENTASLELDFGKAWDAAVSRRPEILILEETMRALELDETARRAEYYPRLFLKGGYDFTENRYQVHEGNWMVTVGVGINLYSGGATSAELRKIAAQKAKLVEQKNRVMEDIKLEIKKYLLDSDNARSRVLVTADSVKQAEENLRINGLRYEEGVGTATEVLDALTLLTLAETNYYRSLYDAKKAEAAVLYATGQNLLEIYK
ncbi:MAG: TolC family protein [Nitrospirae bacterium]|nr:TolC family protein [Nitrospirota bacterium]